MCTGQSDSRLGPKEKGAPSGSTAAERIVLVVRRHVSMAVSKCSHQLWAVFLSRARDWVGVLWANIISDALLWSHCSERLLEVHTLQRTKPTRCSFASK